VVRQDERQARVVALGDERRRLANRFLIRGSNARWSPTGDRIVYTAQGEPKGTQIFVRYMDAEGAVTQITRVEKAPSTWSGRRTARRSPSP
jgi:Tol biopolymer transport system component